MHIAMRREQVVHDDEMDLPPMRQLNPMQPIKPTQQRMRIRLDMLMIILQYPPQELMLRMPYSLDDEPIVPTKVKEGS